MDRISARNYAFSFWKRDFLLSVFTGLFSLGIFFFMILSLRLQFSIAGTLSLSSIEALKNSPDLLFYLSAFSLGFLVLGTIFPRMSDLGVMMAVGGNPWICVKIHVTLIAYLTLPSYVLGGILNYILVPDPGSSNFLSDFFFVQLYALGTYIAMVFLLGVPAVYLSTLKDPYATIRRIK